MSTALIVVTVLASAFLIFVAFPYFEFDQQQLGPYWPRRGAGLTGLATAWIVTTGLAYLRAQIGAMPLVMTEAVL